MSIVITIRAVFKWLSKVITWLRFLRLVIGLKDSRQFFNQWEAKSKPIAPCTRDFSRASSKLQVIARNGSWRCLFLLWLVGVIALVLVFRQSFENRSNTATYSWWTHRVERLWSPLKYSVDTSFNPVFSRSLREKSKQMSHYTFREPLTPNLFFT